MISASSDLTVKYGSTKKVFSVIYILSFCPRDTLDQTWQWKFPAPSQSLLIIGVWTHKKAPFLEELVDGVSTGIAVLGKLHQRNWYAIQMPGVQNSNEWRFFCKWICFGISLTVNFHRLRLQLNSLSFTLGRHKYHHFHWSPSIQLLQDCFMVWQFWFITTCRLARDEPSLTSIKANPSRVF